jgi:hypothetical protein
MDSSREAAGSAIVFVVYTRKRRFVLTPAVSCNRNDAVKETEI